MNKQLYIWGFEKDEIALFRKLGLSVQKAEPKNWPVEPAKILVNGKDWQRYVQVVDENPMQDGSAPAAVLYMPKGVAEPLDEAGDYYCDVIREGNLNEVEALAWQPGALEVAQAIQRRDLDYFRTHSYVRSREVRPVAPPLVVVMINQLSDVLKSFVDKVGSATDELEALTATMLGFGSVANFHVGGGILYARKSIDVDDMAERYEAAQGNESGVGDVAQPVPAIDEAASKLPPEELKALEAVRSLARPDKGQSVYVSDNGLLEKGFSVMFELDTHAKPPVLMILQPADEIGDAIGPFSVTLLAIGVELWRGKSETREIKNASVQVAALPIERISAVLLQGESIELAIARAG